MEGCSSRTQHICFFFIVAFRKPLHYFRLTLKIFKAERPDLAALFSCCICNRIPIQWSTLWNRWSLSNNTLWCLMMSGLGMSVQWICLIQTDLDGEEATQCHRVDTVCTLPTFTLTYIFKVRAAHLYAFLDEINTTNPVLMLDL